MVEYALLAALISVVVIVAIRSVGDGAASQFCNVSEGMAGNATADGRDRYKLVNGVCVLNTQACPVGDSSCGGGI